VTGFPSLASAAYMQGRFASTHVLTGKGDHIMVRDIPTGIYTSPEISSIGRTERELTAENVPYEIGHALFKSLARAQITGRTTGMLKILFHRETLAILGIHCFGANASEIIHIGQAIMAQTGHYVGDRRQGAVDNSDHEAFSWSRASNPSKMRCRPTWPLAAASSRWRSSASRS
jgi:pyruvate/2-oxoglutarate dehydrogenase complex dihydrolipoamide dehydrogenase (E3) component